MIEVTNSRGVRAFNLDLNSTPKGIGTVADLVSMPYERVETILLDGGSVFDAQGNEYRERLYDAYQDFEELTEMEGYLEH